MTSDPTSHPRDALSDAVTGAPLTDAVREHVAACPACAAELEELRAVVGLLRVPVPERTEPPAGLWDAVVAEIEREESVPAAPEPSATPVPTAAVHELAPRRRRVSAWWVGAAAAAGLVVGGGVSWALGRPDPAPSVVVLGSTNLDTLDTKQVLGSAQAVRLDGHLDLDVDTPRLDAGTGYLEVWLINKDLRRMVSVGVLRPGAGTQRFAIDQALIDEGYVIVDISREGFDDKPQHSGDSLVRGTLAL